MMKNIDHSAVMEILSICTFTSHMWLLSIWNVARAIKELNFFFLSILFNFKYTLVPSVYHIVKALSQIV